MTITVEGDAASCAEWYTFGCNFIPPNACDATQVAAADCCGTEVDAPAPEVEPSGSTVSIRLRMRNDIGVSTGLFLTCCYFASAFPLLFSVPRQHWLRHLP